MIPSIKWGDEYSVNKEVANTRSITMPLKSNDWNEWVYTKDIRIVLLKEKANFIIRFIILINLSSEESALQLSSLLNICIYMWSIFSKNSCKM